MVPPAMSVLGGKLPLAKGGRRADEPLDEVCQPNNPKAEDHEGRSPLRLTAIGHCRRAIASKI